MVRALALALALSFALALSGCASKEKDQDTDGASASSSSSGSSSASSTGGSSSSAASSSSTGTSTGAPGDGAITVRFTRSTPNGAVPLAVNVTLDANFTKGGQPQPSPAGLSWSLRIINGTTLADLANATAGPTGTTLPANLSLDFTTPGEYLVLANVTATGYAPANATIQVTASAAGPGVPAFFDGAEGDASQWTIASNVLITNAPLFVAPPPEEQQLDAEHPVGSWAASADQARTGTKSWHPPYPDNLRATMTSVAIPLGVGSHTLTYSFKGGAEGTDIEGLFVLMGPAGGALEVVAHHSGPSQDWTDNTVAVPASAGASLQVQFRFDTDLSCSSEPEPMPPEDPAGLCGDGYNAGGYYVDDILVA